MKENVLETTLAAYRQGLFAGTSGNLSLCDETRGILAITPSSFPYEKMTIDDIMVIRMADGSVVEGPHKPSSEWRMHTAILKGRPDVFGVVHTHSPCATSFAVAVGDSLEQAYLRAVYVEDAAKIYSLALGVGGVRRIPDEEVWAMKSRLGLPR